MVPALHCAKASGWCSPNFMEDGLDAPPPDSLKKGSFKRGWLSRLIYAIGPDLILLAFFASVLAVLFVIYGGEFTFFQSSFLLPSTILLILVSVAVLPNVKKMFFVDGAAKNRMEVFRKLCVILRDWSPLVMIVFIYENFHELTYLIRPETVDGTLRVWDEAIFGIEPTLFFQRITFPLLTEYMTFVYALYFVYATVILAMLYSMKEFFRFREVAVALSFCFYLGLIGYMFVPAVGPRYFMAHEFSVPLVGPFLTGPAAQAWNSIEKVQRDCFPSLHTALTTVSLIYLWRLRRLLKAGRVLFGFSLPLIVSLWISTVYLRYHWVVDLFAGWALAYFCCLAAPLIVKRYYRINY
jgi:membrane-associated phospholipid phosphatase